jgi:hypothetical protein
MISKFILNMTVAAKKFTRRGNNGNTDDATASLTTNLIGSWLEDSMPYWSLRVSMRKVQFCFWNMLGTAGGCKTAIVKNCSFAFAFATRLGTALVSWFPWGFSVHDVTYLPRAWQGAAKSLQRRPGHQVEHNRNFEIWWQDDDWILPILKDLEAVQTLKIQNCIWYFLETILYF